MSLIALFLATALASGQATPGDLGAVESPADFHAACTDIIKLGDGTSGLDPEELEAEMGQNGGATAAVVIVMGEFCTGMLKSAVEGVRQADDYRIGGHKICLDPSLTGKQILDSLGEIIKENDPDLAGVNTPSMLIASLLRLSSCK